MKKIIVILLIAILFFSMSIMPVFAIDTLDYFAQDLIQEDGNVCTIQYYAPTGNHNVLIIMTSDNTYKLVFYSDDVQLQYNGTAKAYIATGAFYYLSFNTYEEAIEALFTNDTATEYITSPTHTYSLQINGVKSTHILVGYSSRGEIYLYKDNAFSDEAAASLESAYYDWYVEKYGKEPEFIKTESTEDVKGILAILEKVLEALTPNFDISFVENVGGGLDIKLKDNNFYKQVIGIKNALSNLFNQNYRDPREFQKINPLKITLRRPIHANADGTGYTYSSIDYGLNDVSLVGDMKWFFGTHYDTGDEHPFVNVDGSYAVKHYTDSIISAFMWLAFGWYLWHNLPDLIGGDIGAIVGTTQGIASSTSSGTTTITTTTDMNTGETKTIKTTKKRG